MLHWIERIFFSSYARSHGYRTVRVAFPVVALTTLLLSLATVTSSSESFIGIKSNVNVITQGDEVVVDVYANAHIPVNAIDVVIDYPEQQLEFIGIDIGESVITLWTEDPHEHDGKVYFRGGVFRKGFIGEHLIGRIRFNAIEGGTAYLKLDNASFVAGDGKGTPVNVERIAENDVRLYINPVEGVLSGTGEIAIITDVDGNGVVDLSDISTFMAAWFTRSKTFDFNGDGKMSFKDFSILLSDSFWK